MFPAKKFTSIYNYAVPLLKDSYKINKSEHSKQTGSEAREKELLVNHLTHRSIRGCQDVFSMRERTSLAEERTAMAQFDFLLLGGQHNCLQELLVRAVSFALVPHLSQLLLKLSHRLALSKRTGAFSKSGTLSSDAFLLLWQLGVRTSPSNEGRTLLLDISIGHLCKGFQEFN